MEGDVPLAVRVNGIRIWKIRLRRKASDWTPEVLVVDPVLGPFAIDDRFAIEVRSLAGASGLAAIAGESHWRPVSSNQLFNLLSLNQLH